MHHDYMIEFYATTAVRSRYVFLSGYGQVRSGLLLLGLDVVVTAALFMVDLGTCRSCNLESWKEKDRWLTAARDVQLSEEQKKNFLLLRKACLDRLKE